MHGTKVNTNTNCSTLSESKKAAMAKEEARSKALSHFDASAAVSLTNGSFLVEEGAARDHANMLASQLSSLLLLMRVSEAQSFRILGDHVQSDIMWLASQLADELQAMLPIIAAEICREGRA